MARDEWFNLPNRLREPEWLPHVDRLAARKELSQEDSADLLRVVHVLYAELRATSEALEHSYRTHRDPSPNIDETREEPLPDAIVEWTQAKMARAQRMLTLLFTGNRRETIQAADELAIMPWPVLAFLAPAMRAHVDRVINRGMGGLRTLGIVGHPDGLSPIVGIPGYPRGPAGEPK